MPIRTIATVAIAVGIPVLASVCAAAQSFPERPIRLVTAETGGGSDFVSRLIAQEISGPLGQAVIVDNRAGIIAVETVARAPSDGYTLLLYGSVVWIEPLLRANVPWDPLKDFAPITKVASSPAALVVHQSVAASSVKDLIAYAKLKPGALNYSSGPAGAPNHLAAELFKSMAGIDLARVPYKSSGPALTAVLSGEVQLMFATLGGAAPHVKAGRLKALAVTSAQPSALAPGLSTVAAAGLSGYESVSLYGLFSTGRTPAARVSRINLETVNALNKPMVKEKFFNTGVETIGSPPEQLTTAMKAEIARLGKVIKDMGIHGE